jgi:hypothetical protein
MSKLKKEEVFIAKALESYFSKKGKEVSYTDGGDPPDIILEFKTEKVGVEIRQLEQNDINNSKTLDNKYENIVKNLNNENFNIDSSLGIWILIKRHSEYINIRKLSKNIKNKLNAYLSENNIQDGSKFQFSIDNIDLNFSVFKKNENYPKNQIFYQGGILSKADSRDYNDVVSHLYSNVDMDYIK